MTKPKTKAAPQKATAEEGLFAPSNTATVLANADRGPEEKPPAKKQEVVPAKPRAPARAAEPARVVPITDPMAIMGMIERLAINKDVDPDKLERILALQERLLDRSARTAFDEAMIAIQTELPVITRDGRIVVQEKTGSGKRDGEITQNTPYARWENIVPVVKPILAKHGLGLTHRIATAPDGRVRVTAVVRGHGHTDDSCYMDLQADTTGSKNNAQAWASSISYAKRHTSCAALNIVTKAEDDDGKGSGKPVVVGEPLTEDEIGKVVDFAQAVGCSGPHLIKHLSETRPKNHPELKAIGDLPRSRYDEAIEALRSYEANKKARDDANKGEKR